MLAISPALEAAHAGRTIIILPQMIKDGWLFDIWSGENRYQLLQAILLTGA